MTAGTTYTGNADWTELQGKINAAVIDGGDVYIERNYKIDRPLMIANWTGTRYGQAGIEIFGKARMWDKGNRSVIEATFNDAPIICLQVNKGTIIRNITLKYPSQGQDTQFGPQSAVAWEPVGNLIPADGGYKSLHEFYKGDGSKGGSTCCEFRDLTIVNSIIGIGGSYNGRTQNGDIMTIKNIRFIDCKYGIAGCQDQEKSNSVDNVACWSKMDYMFCFNKYGAKKPGQWDATRISLAGGGVKHLITRTSTGWGPMRIERVTAESILSIGYWYAGSADMLLNSTINLEYPENSGEMPEYTIDGRYLAIKDCNIRYYGRPEIPMLLYRVGKVDGGSYYLPPIVTQYANVPGPGYVIKRPFALSTAPVVNGEVTVTITGYTVIPGQPVFFFKDADQHFAGQGLVKSVAGNQVTIQYISRSVTELANYRLGIYEKTTVLTAADPAN